MASSSSEDLMLRLEAPICALPSKRPTNAVPDPRASQRTTTPGLRAM